MQKHKHLFKTTKWHVPVEQDMRIYIHTYIHTVREEDRHTHRLTIYEKRLYKNSTSKIVQTQLDEYDCTETNTQTAYEILGKKA